MTSKVGGTPKKLKVFDYGQRSLNNALDLVVIISDDDDDSSNTPWVNWRNRRRRVVRRYNADASPRRLSFSIDEPAE